MFQDTIKAVIFDMDGLLVDSEPFWRRSHVKALSKVGVYITENDVREVAGLRPQDAVKHWYSIHPWNKASLEEVTSFVISNVINMIKQDCKPLNGVQHTIDLFFSQGVPLAIASSSPMEIINVVVNELGLREKIKVIHSAENEFYGKPHPGIYITTANILGVAPENCLVFEDAPNGVLAAKAAKMKCIAVPDAPIRGDKRFCIADAILDSLEGFSTSDLYLLSNNASNKLLSI